MLNKLIRSPHVLEVLVGYGTVHLITLYLYYIYQYTLTDYIIGYIAGGILYTFIEYWFHRVILHNFLFKKAHIHHHNNPVKLKIIAVPLIPVQIYECCLMILLSLISIKTAVMCQLGISISQIIMDYVHLFEHSAYNPWYLKVARNWHKLHHIKTNWEVGHGLTSRFWDVVFNTYPDGRHNTVIWNLYQKYPFTKYLTIPIPLLDFILLQPFIEAETVSSQLTLPTISDCKWGNLLISLISGIIVGLSPLITGIVFGNTQ